VIALVKRWLLGTHQGAVRPRHLDAYLDEFVFRFNRKNLPRGFLFHRLVEQALRTPHDEDRHDLRVLRRVIARDLPRPDPDASKEDKEEQPPEVTEEDEVVSFLDDEDDFGST
jgi:hypothetical protein